MCDVRARDVRARNVRDGHVRARDVRDGHVRGGLPRGEEHLAMFPARTSSFSLRASVVGATARRSLAEPGVLGAFQDALSLALRRHSRLTVSQAARPPHLRPPVRVLPLPPGRVGFTALCGRFPSWGVKSPPDSRSFRRESRPRFPCPLPTLRGVYRANSLRARDFPSDQGFSGRSSGAWFTLGASTGVRSHIGDSNNGTAENLCVSGCPILGMGYYRHCSMFRHQT